MQDTRERTASILSWRWAPFPKPDEVRETIRLMGRMGLKIQRNDPASPQKSRVRNPEPGRKEIGRFYKAYDCHPGIWVRAPYNIRLGGVPEGWTYGKGTKNCYFYVVVVANAPTPEGLPEKMRRWSYSYRDLVKVEPPSWANFEMDVPAELRSHAERKQERRKTITDNKNWLTEAARSNRIVWIAKRASTGWMHKGIVREVRNTRVLIVISDHFVKSSRTVYPAGMTISFPITMVFQTEAEAAECARRIGTG